MLNINRRRRTANPDGGPCDESSQYRRRAMDELNERTWQSIRKKGREGMERKHLHYSVVGGAGVEGSGELGGRRS